MYHSSIIIDNKRFEEIMDVCSSLHNVRSEVIRNHDDNTWWPKRIADWRLRLLIPGLSNRVSYSMIHCYQRVVKDIETKGYEQIQELQDHELLELVKPIGLYSSRSQYIKSMIQFIDKYGESLCNMDTNSLIRKIQKEVDGMGFKLSQCSVLFLHNYHCGIFPVDSGIKDKFGPCIGLKSKNNAYSHEFMRLQLQDLVNKSDLKPIAIKNGYSSLKFKKNDNLMWWAHLVIVYFKRLYCNNKKPQQCPLHLKNLCASSCAKHGREDGYYEHIIIEGCEGTGKTTLAKNIVKLGYDKEDFSQQDFSDLYNKYSQLLVTKGKKPKVWDNSFILNYLESKIPQGKVNTIDSADQLVKLLCDNKAVIVYLTTSNEILLSREKSNEEKYLFNNQFPVLNRLLNQFRERYNKSLPIVQIATDNLNAKDVFEKLFGAWYEK